MSHPLISVIICTHNRSQLLRAAIRSVVEQDFSPTGYEIVVVDNASSDDTRAAVAEFGDYPQVRYVYEPKLGLNPARNAGWRAARGTYAAYFDDDAVAAPGWLAAIREGFASSGDKPPIIGGRVDPIWLAERPAWLSDEAAVALTIVYWGDSMRPLLPVPQEWLSGVNIAIPIALLEEVGGFNRRLDRAGKKLLSNGEILIQRQAQRHGYQCIYHPEMLVHHMVDPARLTQRWFVSRYYWQGISDAVMEMIETRPGYRWRIKQAVRRSVGLLRSREALRELILPTHDPEAFNRKCLRLIEFGHITGLLGAARQ